MSPRRHALRDPAAVHARRWWTLVVLCLSLVIVIVGNTVLNVTLPTLVRELDATNAELQWMVDSYSLVFAGLLLIGGALGDRFGRKGFLTAGLVTYGVGAFVSVFATEPSHLIATRALMGLGAAFIMPATLSIITNVFPPRELGRAIGVWAGLAGAGAAVGPIAGGWLLETFGWASIFVANLPLIALALVGGFFLVPTSRDPEERPLDPLGALLSTLGLGGLLFGIIEGPERGWTDEVTLGAFVAGGALVVAFIPWELRTPHPMLDMRFYENRRFSGANVAIMLTFFAMFGSFFVLTQYLQFVRGYSALETGVRLLPMAAAMMTVAPNSPKLVERVGTKLVVAGGLLLAATGLALFATVDADTSYVAIAGILVVMGSGMAMVMPPATESIMGSLPPGKAGVGSAVNDVTREMGGAIGVAVIGSLLSSGYRNRIGDALAGLPEPAVEVARSSVGGALEVARRAPAEIGQRLSVAATDAFVDGMALGFLIASAIAVLGAVLVLRFLPARATDHAELAAPHDQEELQVVGRPAG